MDSTLLLGDGRWSSLLVVGEGIRIATDGVDELEVPSGDQRVFSASANVPRATLRPFAPESISVLLRSNGLEPGSPFPWRISASSVSRIEWHNATVQCPVGPCPDGASTLKVESSGIFLQWMSYMDAGVPSGQVDGSGTAYAVAMGGPAISFNLTGSMRLPEIALNRCAPAPCPAIQDQTLTLQGVARSHVGPAAGRRLQFRMETTPTAAFSDESAIPIFVRSAAPAIGLSILAALAVKLLIGLASRPLRDPLGHPTRRVLYETILAEPGISYRELMRATGFANGSLSHHLRSLSRSGLIADQPHGRRRLFFENHGRYDRTWQAVAALRDEPTRLLHGWLLGNPRANQGSVLIFSAQHGWSRSATQKRLNRLVAQGLVQALRDGRQVMYVAQDPG